MPRRPDAATADHRLAHRRLPDPPVGPPGRRRCAIALGAVAVLSAATLAACSDDGRELRPPRPDQTLSIVTTTTAGPIITGGTVAGDAGEQEAGVLTLTAPWDDGQAIDTRYTCNGQDLSPRLTWTDVPPGVTELAVAVVDLDADGFVHWLVSDIDPSATGIDEGAVPPGAIQSRNSFGSEGYRGPCPPSGTHTYQVTLYALAEPSALPAGGDPAEALRVLEGNQIEATSVTGTYAA